jgi:hypothetical protein
MEFKRSIECDNRNVQLYHVIIQCVCHIWSTPKTFFNEQMIKEKGIRGLYGSLTPFPVTQVVSL